MNSEDCDSQEHLTYREGKYQRKNYRKKKHFRKVPELPFVGMARDSNYNYFYTTKLINWLWQVSVMTRVRYNMLA